MDKAVHHRLTGAAGLAPQNGTRLRAVQSPESAGNDFAGIFAATAAGIDGRQHLAALPSWITVPVGEAMTVITTPESLPDGPGLRDFAIAQGFDAAALSAIFGSAELSSAAPANTRSALSVLGSDQGVAVTSGAPIQGLSAAPFPGADGSMLAGSAAATPGVEGLEGVGRNVGASVSGSSAIDAGAVSSDLSAEGGADAQTDSVSSGAKGGAPVLPAAQVGVTGMAQTGGVTAASGSGLSEQASHGGESGDFPDGMDGAQKSDPKLVATRTGMYPWRMADSTDLAKKPDLTAQQQEADGSAEVGQLDSALDAERKLYTQKKMALEVGQTFAASAGRAPSTSAFEFSGAAIVPASLHAFRAGWHSGRSAGAEQLSVNAESSPDTLKAEGAAALTVLAGRVGAETGANASGGYSGGSQDVVALDRLAAEVADERLGLLIGQRMLSGIEKGEWRIRLLLKPESLGEVEIQMRIQGGALEAQFSAAQESTKDLLNQGLERLREFFQRSGMEVASLGVSLHQKGGGDGKPTGKSAAPPVKPAERLAEEERSSSAGVTPRALSDGQWDMFV